MSILIQDILSIVHPPQRAPAVVLAIAASLLSCLAVFMVTSKKGSRASYPPGPKPLPFVGNRLPVSHLWTLMQKWAKVYGPILHFRVYHNHFVVLDTIEAATSLFEKRSALYSGRPVTEMAKLVGRDVSVLFSQPGTRFTHYRKLLRAWINPESAKSFVPVQMEELGRFLVTLDGHVQGDTPLIHLARRFAASIALRLAYGSLGADERERFAELGDVLFKAQNRVTQPGHWLVNSFPILRYVPSWMPGTYFKKWSSIARQQITELIHAPVLVVQQEMATGRSLESFASHFLRELDSTSQEETIDIVSCAANSFYAAGTDTVSAYLNNFIFILSLLPEIQAKAHAELDAVIDSGRLVTLEDRDQLPYIESLLMEVHRIHPVAPMLFHSPVQDDVFQGYHIPKGATVYANIWSMLHDPTEYPDPNTFNPDRFLPTAKGAASPLDPRKLVFGLGRRACPGKLLGDNTLYLTVANALLAMRFEKPVTMTGAPLDLKSMEFTAGLVSTVKPFKCNITWRSELAREGLVRLSEMS